MIAYEAADVTLAPDPDDLLGLCVLESLAVGTPVLASARNEAAVEHCRRANAGLYYANRDEFVEALSMLMTNTRLRERLGENGRQYIRQHHRWDAVWAASSAWSCASGSPDLRQAALNVLASSARWPGTTRRRWDAGAARSSRSSTSPSFFRRGPIS